MKVTVEVSKETRGVHPRDIPINKLFRPLNYPHTIYLRVRGGWVLVSDGLGGFWPEEAISFTGVYEIMPPGSVVTLEQE